MKLKIRDEKKYFIITLLDTGCRVHLYYVDKERLKETYSLDISAMYKESFKEFGNDILEFVSLLQYNKVPSHL